MTAATSCALIHRVGNFGSLSVSVCLLLGFASVFSLAQEHGRATWDVMEKQTLSPNGKYVAVPLYRQDKGEDLPHSAALWLLDSTTGKVCCLQRAPLVDYHLDWKEASGKVAFTGDSVTYSGPQVALPLQIADIETGVVLQTLVTPDSGWCIGSPYGTPLAWSQDGKWIAYNRMEFPRGKLADMGAWIVSADGKTHYRLPVPPGVERWDFIGWRPRSTQMILRTSNGLWLADLQGKSRRLSVPITVYSRVFLPSQGQHFLVGTQESGREPGGYAYRLHLYDLEGNPTAGTAILESWGAVCWSRSGEWIASADHPMRGGEITTRFCREDGSARKALGTGLSATYADIRLVWSPDDRLLLVTAGSPQKRTYIVDRIGGVITQILSLPYTPLGWRSREELLCANYTTVAVVALNGNVKKVYPIEHFMDRKAALPPVPVSPTLAVQTEAPNRNEGIAGEFTP